MGKGAVCIETANLGAISFFLCFPLPLGFGNRSVLRTARIHELVKAVGDKELGENDPEFQAFWTKYCKQREKTNSYDIPVCDNTASKQSHG